MKPRAIDRLFGGYTLVAGAALLFPGRPSGWLLLALMHGAAAVLAFGLPPAGAVARRLERLSPRASRLLADWYPLLLVPGLYGELAVLNRAVHDGRYFDVLIVRWEQGIFGSQPSRTLAAALPDLHLSELLHGAYLSYYVIVYGPPLLLYLGGRRHEFSAVVFALMLTFFAHYLFFVYLPVQGPRYLYPAPGGDLAGGFFYKLAHSVLEVGSSRGAAFPSSHVAVAVVQTALALRYLKWAFPWLALLTLGLAVGAVYGGFHYALDAVAGLALGLLLVTVAPRLQTALARSQGRPDQRSQGGADRPASR